MRDSYEVIVVGGRVAGATLAALLGDAGVSVLLVDRARFPSTTCSTHFYRGGGAAGVFARLGVLDDVLALGCPPLRSERTYLVDEGRRVDGPPVEPGEVGFSLSTRRLPLDAILWRRAARTPGVDALEGTAIADLLWDDGRVTGVELADGRRIVAVFVVGADGRHSLVARKVSPAVEHEAPPLRAAYYHYVTDVEAGEVAEFSLLGDELVYFFPSDAGRTLVALSVNLETFRVLRKDLRRGYHERLAEHRDVGPRIAAGTVDGPILGCGPERSYVRVPCGPGWALVGDAALHQDPWSGRGMDLAACHAELLAESLVDHLRGGAGEEAALGRYHERRNAHGLPIYHFTTRFAADLRGLRDEPAAL